MTIERIDETNVGPITLRKHKYRYQVASRFIEPGDTVVDAACGSGYGHSLLQCAKYIGIDKDVPEAAKKSGKRYKLHGGYFYKADLCEYEPDFEYDAFITLETIEHLQDYTNLVEMAKRAGRVIVVSTPIVPTKHNNPYHLHDFVKSDIEGLFVDDQWSLAHYETQEGRPGKGMLYGIWVFTRVAS